MFHHRKAEPPRRAPAVTAVTALDAGATIQDALVRRLRLVGSVGTDATPQSVLEDRAPIAAVVGRKP
jgi:hypothetical protein